MQCIVLNGMIQFCACLICILLCAMGCQQTSKCPALASPDFCTISDVDLGRVWANEVCHTTLKIESRGNGPTTLVFRPYCGCTTVHPSRLIIGNYSTVRATATFAVPSGGTNADSSVFATDIDVSEENFAHKAIHIRAKIEELLRDGPHNWDLGKAIIGTPDVYQVSRTLYFAQPVKAINAIVADELFCASCEQLDSLHVKVTVSCKSPVSCGTQMANVHLTMKVISDERDVTLNIGVASVLARPSITSEPEIIDFTIVSTGTSPMQTIQLSSTRGLPFNLVGLKTTAGLKIVEKTRVDDMRWRVVVGLTNVIEGQHTERLEFKTQEAGDIQREFNLPVTYFAIPSDMVSRVL